MPYILCANKSKRGAKNLALGRSTHMYKAEKSGQMTFPGRGFALEDSWNVRKNLDAIRRLYAQQKEMFDLRRTGH